MFVLNHPYKLFWANSISTRLHLLTALMLKPNDTGFDLPGIIVERSWIIILGSAKRLNNETEKDEGKKRRIWLESPRQKRSRITYLREIASLNVFPGTGWCLAGAMQHNRHVYEASRIIMEGDLACRGTGSQARDTCADFHS